MLIEETARPSAARLSSRKRPEPSADVADGSADLRDARPVNVQAILVWRRTSPRPPPRFRFPGRSAGEAWIPEVAALLVSAPKKAEPNSAAGYRLAVVAEASAAAGVPISC